MTRSYILLFLMSVFACLRIYSECGLTTVCPVPEINLQHTSIFDNIRSEVELSLLRAFPSPHSELLLGLTIGIDRLHKVPSFKQALIDTGTIHVVVVSGYNISLCFMLLYVLIGKSYSRSKVLLGIVLTFFYALLSGFEPPIVRAWIMGALLILSSYYGRGVSGILVLVISALSMIVFTPPVIYSLSFILSFSATLSLMLFTEPLNKLLSKTFLSRLPIYNDLVSTCAAQVLVWPIISYFFGRISIFSPLFNALTLWTIPISTLLASIWVVVNTLSPNAAKVLVYMIYPFANTFVLIIQYVGRNYALLLPVKMSQKSLLIYYLLSLIYLVRKNRDKYDK